MQTLNAVVFDNDFDDIGVCGKKSPINENRLVGIVDIVEDWDDQQRQQQEDLNDFVVH